MRDGFFRMSALVLGLLVVPSVSWQIYQAWPLDWMEINFFAIQALIGLVFLSYGLRNGPIVSHGYSASKPLSKDQSIEV
jgi:hypothetical protein